MKSRDSNDDNTSPTEWFGTMQQHQKQWPWCQDEIDIEMMIKTAGIPPVGSEMKVRPWGQDFAQGGIWNWEGGERRDSGSGRPAGALQNWATTFVVAHFQPSVFLWPSTEPHQMHSNEDDDGEDGNDDHAMRQQGGVGNNMMREKRGRVTWWGKRTREETT